MVSLGRASPAPAKRGKRKGSSSNSSSNKLDFQRRSVPLRNQIRSIERLLNRNNLPEQVREAQEALLKQLQERYAKEKRSAEKKKERKIELRYKQVKFVERRKVERAIRRAEKELRNASNEEQREQVAKKLEGLREDLDYVRFFPPTEKYISLFKANNDEAANTRKQKIRDMIKSRVEEAAAAGLELEETTTGAEEDFATEEEDGPAQKRESIQKLKKDVKGKGPASRHEQNEIDNKRPNENIKDDDLDFASEPEPLSISDDDFFIKDSGPTNSEPVAVKPAPSKFSGKRQTYGKRKREPSNDEETVPRPDSPAQNEKRKRKRKRPKKHK